MQYRKFIIALLAACMAMVAMPLNAQEPVAPGPGQSSDSLLNVEILPGVRKLEFRKLNDSTQLTILAGNVKLKQGTSLFYCDSCVINNNSRTFEAWGGVHINDSDTAHVYSSHMRYLMDRRIAFLDGGVRLTDGKGTLTTPDLEYDMTTSIGTYLHGGRVVNKTTVLTSREGFYYADLHDVYFKNNVVLTDPAYTIRTDSLLYNTQSQITRFIAQTYIRDSSGREIETKEGYYDLANGKAEFGQRPVIKDGPRKYTANNIQRDEKSGITIMRGNAIVVDSAQGTTIVAGTIINDSKNDKTLATNKPLMIIRQEDDSIYITADTLFSARLTDLDGGKDSLVKDTVKGTRVVSVNQKDSTNRYLEAYRNVKIFSDSLQAVSDSLFYSFRDSVFRLYQDPIVWAKQSQISGDTLLLFTRNKKADKVKAFENSFLVNELEPGVYNQVKGIRMDGYFTAGNIDSVRTAGDAACIYYIQDDDSAYTGINESRSEILDIYFVNKELEKVVFRRTVTGTIWPIRQKNPADMKLPGFRWLDSRRPKTKFDLF